MRINSYYLENQNNYINDFANYLKNNIFDEEITNKEINELFKDFMYNYKNINNIDLRLMFWKNIKNEGVKKAGFNYDRI